ncbi:Cof-type HAD-IIB family hydrolase [Neobacillus sp. D3-1R]|uniref:Cof-type HAD-IIB family hydrolase n=1 Tax=Neobacillus sp. D3-1R TaxID=3445778 RepID=UPI003FA169FC
MIKCIATDMDGTLVSSAHIISEENKKAILAAQAKGIEVVVATGRSYQEAAFVLADAGLECPMILANGAEIRTKDGEIIGENPISKTEAIDIAKLLNELDVYFEVYTNHGTYTNDREKGLALIVDIFLSINPDSDREFVSKAAKDRFEEGHIHVVDNYDELFQGEEHKILKLLAFSFDMDRLDAASKTLAEFPQIAISSSAKGNLEINSSQAQKGVALEQFVEKRGISLEETMAIGDNFNDVSMFQRVGRSVAMGNAVDEIKAMCDFVAATNEESGVGKAIMEAMEVE